MSTENDFVSFKFWHNICSWERSALKVETVSTFGRLYVKTVSTFNQLKLDPVSTFIQLKVETIKNLSLYLPLTGKG